jgi:hypothetical protein
MDNTINFISRILAEHGNRAVLEIFTFVFIMIFAARNCMLLSKSSFSLEDVSQAPQQRLNVLMGQFSSTKLRNEIMSKSSLRDYITFYRHKGKQPYLEDMRDFEGSRLKLLCRTNSLCLNNLLSKMSLITGNLHLKFYPNHKNRYQ